MKILIQDPATKFYLSDENRWTPNMEQGLEFASPADALLACDICRLTEFLMLLKFKGPDFEMTLNRTEALRLSAQLEVEE